MKVKKIISSILLIIIIIAFGYFTFKPNNITTYKDSEKLTVVVTTFSSYDFARQIAGDNINLIFLLGPRNRFS